MRLGLWWILLMDNVHGLLIFTPKALHGCPTVEIQFEITGYHCGGKIMPKSYIVP
jgi:hypothetical protein